MMQRKSVNMCIRCTCICMICMYLLYIWMMDVVCRDVKRASPTGLRA